MPAGISLSSQSKPNSPAMHPTPFLIPEYIYLNKKTSSNVLTRKVDIFSSYHPIGIRISIRARHATLLFNLIFSSDPVSIAHNARVLVTSWSFWDVAVNHVAVLRDAIAITGWNIALGIFRLVLRRGPGEVISPYLDVVVCEFAQLIIVHAEKFGFLGRAKVQTGNPVDDEGENGGHDK